MTTDDKPFTVCEHCGSPLLENESLSLVVMFRTPEDRKEFAEAIGTELDLKSYNVDA